MALKILKIKPSLYVTIDPEAKIPEDTNCKQMTFFYVIETKKIIMEPSYYDKNGYHYWAYRIIDPKDIKEIYKFCKELFHEMKHDNYSNSSDKGIDLVKHFNVKTFAGASRKLEFFSFNWDLKYGHYFCKGERNVNGYSWYRNYSIDNDFIEEKFNKGYSKMLSRIEKKLLRKELKKLSKKQNST